MKLLRSASWRRGRYPLAAALTLIAGSAVVATVGVSASSASGCDVHVGPSQSYTTVQAGIDAATTGQTVCVDAGTYNEKILLSKALTLVGPNTAVSALPASSWIRQPEAVLDGTGLGVVVGVDVRADHVTVSGLEITNWAGSGVSYVRGTGDGSSGTFWTFLTLSNNYIHDVASTSGSGLYVFRSYGGNTISGNLIDDLNGPFAVDGSGIYDYYDSESSGQNVISGNLIHDVSYAGILTNGYQGTVSGNVIDHVPQQGLQITGNVGPLEVTGNTITDANYNAPNDLVGQADKGAIRIKAPTTWNGVVDISNNRISGNYNGIVATSGTTGLDVEVTIENNQLSGNTNSDLLNLSGASAPTAASNWWGQSSGPGAQVIGSVSVAPWIATYVDDPAKSGEPGFWPTQSTYRATASLTTVVGPNELTVDVPSLGSPVLKFDAASAGQEVTATVTTTSNPESLDPAATPFQVSGSVLFIDIEVTGASGPFTVCVDAVTPQRLWHYSAGVWVDITDEPVGYPALCGTTDSLSPFAIATEKTSTSTALDSDLNPAPAGDEVTLGVSVSPVGATGTVSILDGSTEIGTCVLSAGACSFPTSTLSVGSHSLTAVYPGDDDYATSTSGIVTQVVETSSELTLDATTPDPSVAGSPVLVSWTLTTSSGTPTGTVTVTSDLEATTCTAAVSIGHCTVSLTHAGGHLVTATYSGDLVFPPASASNPHPVIAAAAKTLRVDPPNGSAQAGEQREFTATAVDRYGNEVGDRTSVAAFKITNGVCADSTCVSTHAGAQTVTATVGTMKGTTRLTVTAAAPAGLQFVKQPSNVRVNRAMTPSVVVAVIDQWGNRVGNSTAAVVLHLGSNSTGASLTGTLTINAVAGLATFSDLRLNKVGRNYSLTAHSAGLFGVNSKPFNVSS